MAVSEVLGHVITGGVLTYARHGGGASAPGGGAAKARGGGVSAHAEDPIAVHQLTSLGFNNAF